jgi:hypothetical protein
VYTPREVRLFRSHFETPPLREPTERNERASASSVTPHGSSTGGSSSWRRHPIWQQLPAGLHSASRRQTATVTFQLGCGTGTD